MNSRIIYFIVILLSTSVTCLGQKVDSERFFRHLRYNHVSPYIRIEGVHEIGKTEADFTSHYQFKYDRKGRVIEIINHHYHTERRHPLTTIGAYRTEITYEKQKEVFTFYDPNGRQVSNDRQVFKEEYVIEKKGSRSELRFYDLQNNPMESNWNIARYQWEKQDDIVIERRFNLKEEAVNVSPYFPFGTTGIKLDKNGVPQAHFNLNQELKVINNPEGIAAYKDVYDEEGNHIEWSYFDSLDSLVNNQWGYAIGRKQYDEQGNNIERLTFNESNEQVASRKIPLNKSIQEASKTISADSIQIKEKALGYISALIKLDTTLMAEVMHEQLAKRTIGFDWKNKVDNIRETSFEQMMGFAESWNKSGVKFSPNPVITANILDVYDRIATVKLTSENWVEYLHLTKINQEWKIINLLWQHRDIRHYEN